MGNAIAVVARHSSGVARSGHPFVAEDVCELRAGREVESDRDGAVRELSADGPQTYDRVHAKAITRRRRRSARRCLCVSAEQVGSLGEASDRGLVAEG